MTRLWTLMPAAGRPGRTAALVVLTLLAPLLVLLAMLPDRAEQTVPTAIVNLDVPVADAATPVAAGKLLTENLLTADGGLQWTLTDTATADAGLASGRFHAVVTIPAGFSQNVATIATDDPEQAQLQVQTSTRHGYLSGVIAAALAAGLPAGVSAELTSGYVSGTLGAYTDLHQGIGQAASGAHTMAAGMTAAAAGAADLATGTEQLSAGIGEIGGVLDALPQGARDLGALSAQASVDAADLARSLGAQTVRAEELALAQDVGVLALDALLAQITLDPAAPSGDLLDELAALRAGAAALAAQLQDQTGALGADALEAAGLAVGARVVADLSLPVADGLGRLAVAEEAAASGAGELADGMGALQTGLEELAGGSDQLAAGLDTVSADIPSYTADQQKSIASVVATPIGVQSASVGGPATWRAASVAALAPVALWLGALATFLVIAPYARSALGTPASARRIAADGALIAVTAAVVQALLIGLGVAVLGVAPERVAATFGFAVIVAVCFALVHQALCALLGRAGLLVSLVALGLQLMAAGTLGSAAAAPLSLLPLSLAMQGAQALVGGSLHEVLQAAFGLAVWAVVAFPAAVIGVNRARRPAAAVLAAA